MEKISWETLHETIENCNRCPLGEGCKHKVPGQGAGQTPLMVVGEGPGQREDETGVAFIGPAGQLLTRMLLAIGIERKDVYITNVIKCRPPGNRVPSAYEREQCLDFLRKQVALVKPKVILLLGATAVNALLGEEFRITKDRGKWFKRKNISFIATFHPSALLRDESKKALAWEDLKMLREYLDQEKLLPKRGENNDRKG